MMFYRYATSDYEWRANSNGNLEGFNKATEKHCFTWQPHGAKFTVLYDIPASIIKFAVKQPPVLDFQKTLKQVGFNESWIKIK